MTDTSTVTATRGKRGDGPISIAYVNAAGAEGKRAAEDTNVLRIKDKAGKAVDFSLSTIPTATLHALAVMGFAKRVDTFVRNSVKVDGGDVVELATGVYNDLVAGKIYARKEGGAAKVGGGKSGRPFDTSYWRAVYKKFGDSIKKPLSDAQLDAVEAKFAGMTPAERKVSIKKAMDNKAFAGARKMVDLEKLKASIKADGGAGDTDALLADMF